MRHLKTLGLGLVVLAGAPLVAATFAAVFLSPLWVWVLCRSLYLGGSVWAAASVGSGYGLLVAYGLGWVLLNSD